MNTISIPREPNAALLRPFIDCSPQELPEAWAAMFRIAEVQQSRAGSSTLNAWRTLCDFAEGRIGHTNAGSCPDSIEGPAARDSDCPVCQALDALARAAPTAVVGPASDFVKTFLITPDSCANYLQAVSTEPADKHKVYAAVWDVVRAVQQMVLNGLAAAPAQDAPAGTPYVEFSIDPSQSVADSFAFGRAAPALEAPAAPDLRKTRDKAGILHYLTPEQMAEEIVRLDARLAAAPQAPTSPVVAELERAMRKFPMWPSDPLHALAILGEEFGELTKDMLQLTYEPHKTSPEQVRIEAVQTAAMALRLVMSLSQYVYTPSLQHSQAQPTAGGAA